jgi:hypothetical protein
MKHPIINKILTEWAYRVHDGMPNPKNPLHIVHLKESMQHLKIDEEVIDMMINALDKDIISEAATNRTEDLHEIFFAIAFAGGKISKAKNLKDIKKIINGLGMLDKKKKHIDTLTRFDKVEPLFTQKDISLYTDATNIADKTKKYLKSNKLSPTKVSRVFGTGPGGTKMIADAVITLANGEIVSVSLKYQKGQFSSLSIPILVEKLWGLKLDKGLLKDMYQQGYSSEIDTAFNYYQLATIADYENVQVGTGKFTEEDKKALDDSSFTVKSSWMDYLNTSILPVAGRKAISHLYHHPDNKDGKQVHAKMKGTLLNNAIDHFFESKSSDLVGNLEDAIIYIIRAESNTNYLYIADGGKKFALIPSAEAIKGKKYTFKYDAKTNDDGTMKSADYTYDVEVSVDGIKAFTFDIKWRFAGQAGQWDGDLQHKGSKIIFHSGFSKAFGLPNIPKDM